MICARRLLRAQMPLAYEIERASFPSPWSLEELLNDFDKNPCARYLALWEDGRMAGYAAMWLLMEEAHVVSVAIRPEARGRGLGAHLMRALMQTAANGGARYMELECRRGNAIAQAMYHKLGFLRVGCKKGYYEDTGEDALVFALPCLPEARPDDDPFLAREP